MIDDLFFIIMFNYAPSSQLYNFPTQEKGMFLSVLMLNFMLTDKNLSSEIFY